MPFKREQNPWQRKDAEIAELKRQIDELHYQRNVKPFVRALADDLALLMSTRPTRTWSAVENAAFENASRQFPVYASMWKWRIKRYYKEPLTLREQMDNGDY